VIPPEHTYLFDLQGYLVLEGILGAQDLARLNEAFDEHAGPGSDRFRGSLEWDEAYRRLLDHPAIVPYLAEWIDPAFRLDHHYGIASEPGKPAHELHLGATPHHRSAYYDLRGGRIYCGLTVVSWALRDMSPGQGGFACIPGSHKANFSYPGDYATFARNPGCVVEVPQRAGDVIIFTEALTHGAFPWTAAHQRRSVLFKYSPATSPGRTGASHRRGCWTC
jgi:Phytanoyl-CoA dioxygenase (PhyH)